MALTAKRCDAVRQIVKSIVDELEAEFGPAADITAFHQTLATADTQWAAIAQRLFNTGPIALDGDPKPSS